MKPKFTFLLMACLLVGWLNGWGQTTRYVPESAGTPGYATIQAAINAATAGDVIEVAAGTYEFTSQMNIDKYLTINGTGTVIFKANNASWSTVNGYKHLIGIYAGTSGSPVTISNVTMDCNSQCFGLHAYNDSYGNLTNVTINGSKGAGLTVNGSTIIATDLNTSGNAWGAVNVDPGYGVITPSVFTLNSGTLAENNQIWSDGSNVNGSATVTVNATGYNRYNVGTVKIWTNRPLANCATITKDGETTIYATIQAAIDAATAGDVIEVAAGTYTENLTINKRLTIDGAGSGNNPASNTVITSAMGGTPVINLAASGLSATERLIVKDVYLTGATGSGNNASGIYAPSTPVIPNYVTVDNVTFYQNAGLGISINSQTEGTDWLDWKILNSTFIKNSSGLKIAGNTDLDGFVIDGCSFTENLEYGMVANATPPTAPAYNNSTNWTIQNSTFTGNGTNGPSVASRLGNVNIGGFNGNLIVNNITIDGQEAGADHGFSIGGRGNAPTTPTVAPAPAGTMSFSNVTIQGKFIRPGLASVNPGGQGRAFSIKNYSDVSNVTFSNVNLLNTQGNSFEAMGNSGILNIGDMEFGAPMTGTLGSGTAPTGENDGTRKMYSIVTRATNANSIGKTNINATGASFTGLNASTLSDAFAIADRIFDAVDDGARGYVNFKTGEVFVTTQSYGIATTAPSIQRGIEAAATGNTVNVKAGTYTRNDAVQSVVVINKSLTLKGANAGVDGASLSRGAETVINGSFSSSTTEQNMYVVSIQANNVVLDGFEVTHPNYSVNSASDFSGILVGGGPQLSGIQIINNKVHDLGSASWAMTGDDSKNAVNVGPVNGLIFSGNKVYDNAATGGAYCYGITTWGNSDEQSATNITVSGNTFSNITGTGGADDQARAVSLGYKTAAATVSNNTISGIKMGVTTSASAVSGNVLISNNNMNVTAAGVWARSPFGLTVQNNFITGSTDGVRVRTGAGLSGSVVVENNHITGVTKALNNASTASVSATCNWLGSTDPSVIATKISGNVDYIPFLSSGTDNEPTTPGFQPAAGTCTGGPVVVYQGDGTTFVSSHTTIQGAIDAATTLDGYKISVPPGTYTEAVSINKPNLTLQSTGGKDVTIIDNPNVGSETPGIGVVANMGIVTVDGFTVNNFRNGIIQGMASGVGTTFIVKNNKVIPENNSTTPYLRNGIQVSGANSQVLNNYVVGAPLTSTWASSGIGVVNATGVLVKGNTVNTASADIGISVLNWSADLVENITIEENHVMGAKNSVRISGQNQEKAVKGVTIKDNTLTNSPTSSGINVQTVSLENLTVTGNIITGHFVSGIRFSSSSATLTGVVNINGNAIYNNNSYEIDNGTALPINATCNWWGSADYNTVLASVNGNVDAVNYLVPDGTGSTYTWSGSDKYACTGDVWPVHNTTKDLFYTTIQGAINAATAGDVIEVAAGTYTENIDVSKALTILGPNASVTGNGSRNPEAVVEGPFLVNANNVTIKGFYIDGTNVQQNTNLTMRGVLVGNVASQSNVTIENNIIKSWVTGVSLAGGLSFPWNVTILIKDNKFIGTSIGSTENVNGLSVLNNYFDNGGVGLGGGAVLTALTGNTFINGTGRYVSAAAGVEIDFSNVLANNTFDKTVYLNNASGPWYDRAIFTKINSAASVAAAGATLLVSAGTFAENITVTKSMTIDGAGEASTKIIPTSLITTGIAHHHAPNVKTAMLVNNAAAVTLKDLTIDYQQATPYDAVLFWNASSGSIENVTINAEHVFSSMSGHGLMVDVTSPSTVTLNVSNCTFSKWNRNAIDAVNGNSLGSGGGNMTVNVTNCVLNGRNDFPALTCLQNGINLWNRGGGSVLGTLDGVTMSDLAYNDGTWTSYGIAGPDNDGVIVMNTTLTNVVDYIGTGYGDIDATLNNTFEGKNTSTAGLSDLFAIEDRIYHQIDDAAYGFVKIKDGNVYVTSNSGSIQRGVDAASSGWTVNVNAGTYTEQIHINKNNLTVQGVSKSTVLIKSPASLPLFYNSGTSNNYPIVFVDGVSSFTMKNATVDGDGKGNANYRFQGIGFWNAGGTLQDVDINNIMDTPFSGAQHGVALYAYNNTGSPYSITCTNMLIDDYQKGGVSLMGTGLTVALTNITTVGEGPTSVTAQNGIQIAYGANGTINNANVSGNIYTGSGWSSAGILLYESGTVNISNSIVTDNYVGIDVNDSDGSISNTTVSNQNAASWDGIYLRKYKNTEMNFDLTGVSVLGHGKADSWGVLVRANTGKIESDITQCQISNWDLGVYTRETSPGIVNVLTNYNNISNNALGYDANTTTLQDATLNYWGGCPTVARNATFYPYYKNVSGTPGGFTFAPADLVSNITATASSPAICLGQSVTLTAGNGSNFEWFDGTGTSIGYGVTKVVTPAATGTYTYTLRGTDTNTPGCAVGETTVSFTVNPEFDATITKTGTGPFDLEATAGSSYLWSTGATTQSISVNPSVTTTYSVLVTSGTCSDLAEITIDVVSVNAGSDQSICAGGSATLTVNVSGLTNPTFSWTSNPESTITNPTAQSITVSPSVNTTYTVNVEAGGAEYSDDVVVTVRPAPVANAGADKTIFAGQSATLTGSATGGTPSYSYVWTPGSMNTATVIVSPSSTTTYTLNVTDAYGCTDPDGDQVLVTVNALPPSGNTVTGNVAYAFGTINAQMHDVVVTLTGTGSEGTFTGTTAPTGNGNYSIPGVPDGTYIVTLNSPKPWGGVDNADVTAIANHYRASRPVILTGIKRLAADVVGSSSSVVVNSSDRDEVFNRIKTPPTVTGFSTGDWVFTKDGDKTAAPFPLQYANSLGSSIQITVGVGSTTHNFSALCYGDVNASYNGIKESEIPLYDGTEDDWFSLVNFPNPFSGQTTFSYNLPVEGKSVIEVFDLTGNRLAVLENEDMKEGVHEIYFNGRDLAPGVYLYMLSVKTSTDIMIQKGKMIVMP